MGSEWGSPIERIYDDRSNENILVCCQPMLFEAIQDSTAPNPMLWSGHSTVLHNEISKS